MVTDLSGNVLWNYNPIPRVSTPNQLSILRNGRFLIGFFGFTGDSPDPVLREIDLAGQTIWELTAAQLNEELAVATCAGCNITAIGIHHDFALLPTGHIILIEAENRVESGLTGFPEATPVIGDVLIDLDENHKPVWLWSSFDHLDLNRHLTGLPDWTHSNSVVYSPNDKALIMSMRHQSWGLKIDYNDSQGSGNIIWRLGYQGDFILEGGVDPEDWFSFQHDANITSSNSNGIFLNYCYLTTVAVGYWIRLARLAVSRLVKAEFRFSSSTSLPKPPPLSGLISFHRRSLSLEGPHGLCKRVILNSTTAALPFQVPAPPPIARQ